MTGWAIFFWGLGWMIAARRQKKERNANEEEQPLLGGGRSLNATYTADVTAAIGSSGNDDLRRQRVQTLPPISKEQQSDVAEDVPGGYPPQTMSLARVATQ